METQKADEAFNECIKYKYDSNASPLWKLIRELYIAVKAFAGSPATEEPEKVTHENEWLTPDEFTMKYPDIMSPKTFYTFVRYGHDTEKFAHRNKQLDSMVINPRNFFEYIFDNKKKFTRLHARLVRKEYFGFKFIEKEQTNG